MGSTHSHSYQGSDTSNQSIEKEVMPIESNIVKNLNPIEIPQTTQKVEPMPSKQEQFRTCVQDSGPPYRTGTYFKNIAECHNMHGK